MAYKITERCVNCFACQDVCPSHAIRSNSDNKSKYFSIEANSCTECVGDFANPQCASICPVEGAILDSFNQVVNPPGSLTGISPELLNDARIEIQSR